MDKLKVSTEYSERDSWAKLLITNQDLKTRYLASTSAVVSTGIRLQLISRYRLLKRNSKQCAVHRWSQESRLFSFFSSSVFHDVPFFRQTPPGLWSRLREELKKKAVLPLQQFEAIFGFDQSLSCTNSASDRSTVLIHEYCGTNSLKACSTNPIDVIRIPETIEVIKRKGRASGRTLLLRRWVTIVSVTLYGSSTVIWSSWSHLISVFSLVERKSFHFDDKSQKLKKNSLTYIIPNLWIV